MPWSRPTRLRAAIVAVLAAVVLALLWLSRGGGAGAGGGSGNGPGPDAARPERPAPVVVQAVRLDAEQARIEAVGTARARRSVMLHPAAAGEVREVLFTAGDRVRAGAPMLRLDARREQLAVAQARVELRQAQELLARYERTRHTGALSESQIDQGRNAVESARIALRQAEVALADRTVRAPFDGHVGFTEIDPGDRVDPATPIASFDDRGELFVDFALPEAYIDALRPGTAIVAEPWTTGGAAVPGRIDRIGTRVDPAERSFTARARLANPGDALRPGLGFRITLELPGRAWPVLPEAAIVWGEDGSYLWRIEDGRAVRVPAAIVQRREGRVLVDAKLREGERIVVEGVQRLREGMPVRIEAGARPAPLAAVEARAGGTDAADAAAAGEPRRGGAAAAAGGGPPGNGAAQ